MAVRSNARVNLRRLTTPSGFTGVEDIYTVKPDFRARLQKSPQVAVSAEGEVEYIVAFLTVEGGIDIRPRDIIEVMPDLTEKFFVESVRDVLHVSGRVSHKIATLKQDDGR